MARLNYSDLQLCIDTLLSERESSEMEFKSAAGGFPGSFWETYSSFANTNGGVILLGIEEKPDGIRIPGFSDELIEKYKKEFWSGVNNKNTVNVNILKEDDVKVGEYNNRKFLAFNIPSADRTQRPVYKGLEPYSGTFKRNFEGDYKCTRDEVTRMFADADFSQSPDERILDNYSMEDIDADSLAQYRHVFSSMRPGHAWATLDDITFLKKLGAYRTDRKTKKEGFTLAGILMFGKEESITDSECAPHYFPDYKEIPNDATYVRWTDRICPDGTWNANLFQFYKRVLPKLQAALPRPFLMKDSTRIEDLPSSIAIREAFINALIHADYSVNASLVVEQYSNRFVLSNPGTLLISLHQYYEGGESVPRNKNLQKMFMMIGKAEKAGSGVDKIMAGWQESRWKRPLLTFMNRPDKVVLTLSMESMLPKEVKDGLVRYYGERVLRLNGNYLEALAIAYSENQVSNERLRFAVDMHRTDITYMLRDLCQQGFLQSEGATKGTKYHLIKPSNVATSGPNVATSDSNVATSSSNVATSDSNVATSIPKKLPREKLERVIMNYCKDDYRSVDEIASYINRSRERLKNAIIPVMIDKGLLGRLYPPRHPNQKYKTQ
jgi:ATP-dependent DNA helicase RecG